MQAGRRWTPGERELLATYARHVSVAVTVAGLEHRAREASIDDLTGLGNRSLFLDRLQHELVRCDRGGTAPTLLYIDLDCFKAVNDSLGHFAGDQLLSAVAQRLRACVRDNDVCARLGGDEFAILLAAGADPPAVAQRILVELHRPFEIDGVEVAITVSLGIATGAEEAQTLLSEADRAMYDAKRSGGGHFEYYRAASPEGGPRGKPEHRRRVGSESRTLVE
jgi:diguanylate cyclase (GGDEF)-like protein